MMVHFKVEHIQTFAPPHPCRLFQVIAHHPMQSISFASGGDTVSAALNSTFSFMLLLEWTFFQAAHIRLDSIVLVSNPMTAESMMALI